MGSDSQAPLTAQQRIEFQSTLPRGERHDWTDPQVWAKAFQSTLPRGERLIFNDARRMAERVSIHAPAWGATMVRTRSVSKWTRFNPRSRVGSDERVAIIHVFACLFQSTLPRGERPPALRALQLLRLFQSTLPRGERQNKNAKQKPTPKVSIHAPAWGATTALNAVFSLIISFNPRSRVGSDTLMEVFAGDLIVSIHAPAWGATFAVCVQKIIWVVSIHAPAWGATIHD